MKKALVGLSIATLGLFVPLQSALAVEMVSIFVPTPPNFRVTDLGLIISSTFAFLLIVAGLLAFVFLVLGGIQWITSGGDKAGLEGARNRIIHAIVGLIVVFSAWAITILLQQFLGITILGGLMIPRAYQ